MNFKQLVDSMVEDIWEAYDTNNDGFLQRDEVIQFLNGSM